MFKPLSLALVLFCVPCFGTGFCQSADEVHLSSLMAAAQAAQGRQDYGAAADAYRAAVKLHPEIAELRANLGVMEYEAAQFEVANADLSKALRMKPDLFAANLFLGLDELRLEHSKVALRYLTAAEKLNPSDPQTLLAIGSTQSSLKNYPAAAKAYRRAVALDETSSPAWFDLGMAYLAEVEEDSRALAGSVSSFSNALFAESLYEQRRYLEAVDNYKRALADQSQPPCLRSSIGFVHMRQGKAAEAAEQFDTEGRLHPECNSAHMGKAAVDFAAEKNDEGLQELERAWAADHSYTLTNLPFIVDVLGPKTRASLLAVVIAKRHQAETEGRSGDLLDALSQRLSGTDLAVQAITKEARVKSPLRGSPPSSAAEAYLAGHYSQCATRLNPLSGGESTTQLRLAAKCSYMTGDYDSASNAAGILKTRLPEDAEGLYWSIRSNQKLALASLERFQQIAPDSPQTHLLLGDMDRQRSHFDEAIAEYKLALDRAPNDIAALQGLTSAFLLDGKIDEAAATATSALQLKPDDPELNLLLGEVLVAQHKYEEAEVHLKSSLATGKPQLLPQAHALLGEVYAATDRTAEAIANFKLGLEADQDGSYHYQLARLYRRTGDTTAASAAMTQAKLLAQQRRARAVVAVQEASQSKESQP